VRRNIIAHELDWNAKSRRKFFNENFPNFVGLYHVVSRRTTKSQHSKFCQLTRLVSLECITSNAEIVVE